MITEKDRFLKEDLVNISKRKLPWDMLKGATVLVTGATGLVGSVTAKALLMASELMELKMNIVVLVRNEQKAKKVFEGYLDSEDFTLLVQDINKKIETDIKADYIIHSAAIVNSKLMVTMPVETIDTSINGTRNIFEYAKECDSKSVVYVSSMEIYGAPDENLKEVTEKDYGFVEPLRVRSCYPEGKRICECMMAAYCHEYGVNAKSARLSQTFGAGVSHDDTRVFAQFARNLINNEDIVLHTDGTSLGNYCYTADCVAGILYVLLLGKNMEAYNITNEENNVEIREMANIVAGMSGGKIKLVYDIPKDSLQYGYAPKSRIRLSSGKLNKLGWSADVKLEQMYERLIGSWDCTK